MSDLSVIFYFLREKNKFKVTK